MPKLSHGIAEKFVLKKKLIHNSKLKTVTYLAVREDGTLVIVKTITTQKNDNRQGQIEREIECLESNNLLVAYSYQDSKKIRTYLMAYDLIPGQNLVDFITANNFDSHEWLVLFYHLAQGLLNFHDKNYAHRDVKPDNFIINNQGIHAIDFGNASKKDLADNFYVIGQHAFLAPEVIAGTNNNQLSDLTSLGYSFLILLKCIQLTPVFRTEPDFKENIPSKLAELNFTHLEKKALLDIFTTLLSKKPAQRPALTKVCKQLKELAGNTDLSWINSKRFSVLTLAEEKESPAIPCDLAKKDFPLLNPPVKEPTELLITSMDLSQLQYAYPKELPPEFTEFNQCLGLLAQKQKKFKTALDVIKDKSSEQYLKYQTAHTETQKLRTLLEQEARKLCQNSNPTPQNHLDFKKKCTQHINDSRTILQTHRDFNYILGNVGLAIIGLGVFYAAACAINWKLNKHCLFFEKTNSSKILDALQPKINQIAPAA